MRKDVIYVVLLLQTNLAAHSVFVNKTFIQNHNSLEIIRVIFIKIIYRQVIT